MLENNRDEINYHKFLKSVRKAQKASLEKTAFGVCSKSGMSRIEAGNRLPDKLVRDRLTARLGISGEEYEEYLLPKEYEQWQLRMEIIRSINKKDIIDAEEKITKYKTLYNINSVEKQFIETMKYMVYEMKGFSKKVLCVQIYDAMICTIPDMDAAFDGIQLLADQELNLIMEYIRLCTPKVPVINATEWKLKQYNKIVAYVEQSRMDKIQQAKVYSKLACFVSELVLSEYMNEESLRYALELCTRAVEVLRDTFRLYYFVELNEYRIKIIENLLAYVNIEEERNEFKELSHTSDEWAKLLSELYTENELPIYMQNFTYLYAETECNDVREVIRARRSMMNLPRRKFDMACDERTLLRLELEQGSPLMATVREVFDRMGICAEYKRTRIVTSDVEALHAADCLFIEMNAGRFENAFEMYTDLCEKIDMDIPFNEQEMKRVETVILRKRRKISAEEDKERLIDILECTLSMEAFLNDCEKYLSRTEYFCLQDFAIYTKEIEKDYCRKYLEDICNKVLEMESLDATRFCIYECAMAKCANYIGNAGKHEESRVISRKLLKESLRNRRMTRLVNCEYNELWNYQQLMKLNNLEIDSKFEIKSLYRGLCLSEIAKLSNWKRFFQQKLNI